MGLDINKKIEGIMQSVALDDLSLKYLPPVADNPSDYYFISYSHKDYKQVYSDIYALQAEGVNIWYDRAMPAGESWERTAEKYIRPSRCAGVVFYVSENSLLSPAIHKEIEFAKQCGKSCLTINLPMNDGKSYSARQMLDIMISSGAQIPADKYNFIAQTFNDDVLYLPYSQSAEHKAEKILRLEKPPLLIFNVKWKDNVSVKAVSDNEIQNVKEQDFNCIQSDTKKSLTTLEIDNCAFANCTKLQSVDLPSSCKFIQKYAFYGCSSLSTIKLKNVLRIGESAFYDCSQLKEIDLSSSKIRTIKRCSFWNCGDINLKLPKELKQIDDYAFGKCNGRFDLPVNIEKIGKKVFSDGAILNIFDGDHYFVQNECLIEKSTKTIVSGNIRSSIPINDKVLCIGEGAFMASELTSISIPHNIVSVNDDAFFNCVNLQKINISTGVKSIGSQCFYNCSSLHSVTYLGTVAQWNDIVKMNGWNYQSNIEKIICLDGEIIL